MPWLYGQFIVCNTLQFLCNNRKRSNVMENIHRCNDFASWIFSNWKTSKGLLRKIAARCMQ